MIREVPVRITLMGIERGTSLSHVVTCSRNNILCFGDDGENDLSGKKRPPSGLKVVPSDTQDVKTQQRDNRFRLSKNSELYRMFPVQ